MSKRVLIVPCSGIGKSYGTVAREGAYVVTEDLCPEKTKLVPLAMLVLAGEEARSTVAGAKAITIDGCKLACAANVVAESGGTVAHSVDVPDVYRRHRDLKPSGIAELDEKGHKLAQALAEEVRVLVDGIQEEVSHA